MKTKQNYLCVSCRYYSQHFSKQGTRYDWVCCGHCLNSKVRNYKAYSLKVCEYWEDAEIIKKERVRSIKETLEFMAARLCEMVQILKDDKEN